ncbi:unnamed protein product, partial [Didymodactylos carnosus]
VLQEISLMSLTSSTPDKFGILFADLIVKLKDMKSGLVYNELGTCDPKWPWPSILTSKGVVQYYKVGLDGIHLIVTPNAVLWSSYF